MWREVSHAHGKNQAERGRTVPSGGGTDLGEGRGKGGKGQRTHQASRKGSNRRDRDHPSERSHGKSESVARTEAWSKQGEAYPAKIQATARQLIERRSPLQRATPTVEPVMHCQEGPRCQSESGEEGKNNEAALPSSSRPECRTARRELDGVGPLVSRRAPIRRKLEADGDLLTVMAEPSSIEKPRDGECRVIRLPRTRMMLLQESRASVRKEKHRRRRSRARTSRR